MFIFLLAAGLFGVDYQPPSLDAESRPWITVRATPILIPSPNGFTLITDKMPKLIKVVEETAMPNTAELKAFFVPSEIVSKGPSRSGSPFFGEAKVLFLLPNGQIPESVGLYGFQKMKPGIVRGATGRLQSSGFDGGNSEIATVRSAPASMILYSRIEVGDAKVETTTSFVVARNRMILLMLSNERWNRTELEAATVRWVDEIVAGNPSEAFAGTEQTTSYRLGKLAGGTFVWIFVLLVVGLPFYLVVRFFKK